MSSEAWGRLASLSCGMTGELLAPCSAGQGRACEVAPDCALVVSWASLAESPPQFGSHQLPNSTSSCSKDHGRSQLSAENLGISCCLLLCDPGIGAGRAHLSSVVKVS